MILCSSAQEPQLLKPKCPRACTPQQEKQPQREALTPTTTGQPVQQQRPTQPQKIEMEETSVAKNHTYKNTQPQSVI